MLYTDHDALKHLSSQEKVSARHASWNTYLQQFTFVIKHQSRSTKRVADALSHRHSLLTTLSVFILGFSTFLELYLTDPFFSQVLDDVRSGVHSDYLIYKDFLFLGN